MKHTDYFAQTRAIKALEYKELYAAVEAHKGSYEWNPENGDYPTIAVNPDSICPNPIDVNVYKVSIENGLLKIYGEEKEYGNGIHFRPEEAFAGHLSFIIGYIPPTEDVEDVTCRQEYFPVMHICRDDVGSQGYEASDISDEDMTGLAKKMGDAYCEDGCWEDLRIIAGHMNIPMSVDSWFGHLDFKEMERITGFGQEDFPSDEGYQEFVDACENWWDRHTRPQKLAMYNEKNN